MEKVWEIKKQTEKELIKQLLVNRGILSQENIEDFLDVSYAKLHDPYIFRDMRKAARRIVEGLLKNEKILIYSDYDADAITANALLFRLLKLLGAQPDVYIPDRFSEGYGLNLVAFEKIKEKSSKIVITVDCGTNSIAEAEFCKANGMDLIITDHHEITGELPEAFALINPKNPQEKYPYDQLTGVGVAFKLACAILSEARAASLPQALALPAGFEKWLLDLVAIGTIADCHSLLGENRILVKYGLRVLAKTKWPGLRTLMQGAGIWGKPQDAYTVGFIIAPRINAAGRIEHAKSAFDLLVTDNQEEALKYAETLNVLNSRRQMLTENVMSEARQQLLLLSERKILLAAGTDWPKGVVGLVAGKLTEEFGKPVLVMERGLEESTGSARSVRNFNIVEALNYSKSILVKYGGHAAAAGFTLRTEHIDIFYKNLLDYAEENMQPDDAARVVAIDAQIQPEEINLQTMEVLEHFEPFGMDNPKPVFLLSGARLESFNAVGKEQKHLQLSVSAPLANGSRKLFKAIAFNFGRSSGSLKVGQQMDLVFEMLSDAWQGVKTAKLRVIDFKAT